MQNFILKTSLKTFYHLRKMNLSYLASGITLARLKLDAGVNRRLLVRLFVCLLAGAKLEGR